MYINPCGIVGLGLREVRGYTIDVGPSTRCFASAPPFARVVSRGAVAEARGPLKRECFSPVVLACLSPEPFFAERCARRCFQGYLETCAILYFGIWLCWCSTCALARLLKMPE